MPGRLALALLVAATLSACAGSPSARVLGDDADVPITRREIVVVVHGMSCPLCATNVERELRAVRGVTGVTIDMFSGDVAVSLSEGSSVTPRALAEAVDRTGFTLERIDAR